MTEISKGCGIVCEYNPFHTGHAYQMQKVKDLTGKPVVCVMSGGFTQRAEPACRNKLLRAGDAVKNGADIVLELPFPYSCMGARDFAYSAVSVLIKSGMCDSIAFGSECDDIDLLNNIAHLIADTSFNKSISEIQKSDKTLSYARARILAAEKALGKTASDVLANPNDILAAEYLRANILYGSPLKPISVKRETPRGGKDNNFASSSYIRAAIDGAKKAGLAEIPDEIKRFLPYDANIEDFETDFSLFETVMHLSICAQSPKRLENIAEVPHGAGYLIFENALKSKTYGEFLKNLSTKCFTNAKIRRMILFCFFGITKEQAKEELDYTFLLASTMTGRTLLSETRGKRDILLASKAANLKGSPGAMRRRQCAKYAEEVVEKCHQKQVGLTDKKTPTIL